MSDIIGYINVGYIYVYFICIYVYIHIYMYVYIYISYISSLCGFISMSEYIKFVNFYKSSTDFLNQNCKNGNITIF